MELNTHTPSDPIRDAASVVMLRDAPAGLEVFLLKRHGLSDVLGGAYVFPGGKLDTDDAHPETLAMLDESPPQLHARLGEAELGPVDAAALFVAALREAFEETGVLYAAGAGAVLATDATTLLREGRAFDEVIAMMGLRLDTRALSPWSRWITPVASAVSRKRFDTRFFIARVPVGQSATHDNHEATASRWLPPRIALEQYWQREIELAPPQIMSLAHLSRHDSVDSVLAQARGRLPPLIQPEPIQEDGLRVLCYPGDERHPVVERALPGPTRLVYREQWFQPVGGFEAFFT
jgi:8-oxo-dGTP pyrophosphatase MutT (NUDIX family)